MKTQLLAALAAFPLVAGAADLAPGTFELAGTSILDLGTGSTEYKANYPGTLSKVDHTQANVGLAGLLYVLPNFGVGVTASYDYSKSSVDGLSSIVRTVSAGPVLSWQVPLADRVAVFGRASTTLIRGATNGAYVEKPEDMSGYGFGLQAGLKYFPVRAVSLDAGPAWSWTRISYDVSVPTGPGFAMQDVTVTSTTRNLGLQAGVSVYFGGGR